MSELTASPSGGRSFWRGLGMFILWLIRLIFAIGLGTLLGVAIYYAAYEGIPAFYSQILGPIQVHSVKIDILQTDLQNTQSTLGAELRAARGDIRTLQRLVDEQAVTIQALRSSLEAEKANREQRLGLLQSDMNRMDEAVQRQSVAVGKLEGNTAGLAASLEKLNGSVATLQEGAAKTQQQAQANESDTKRLADNARALDDNAKALQGDVLKISNDVKAIQGELLGLREIVTMPVSLSNAFERRLVLMQVAEAILKARLHLLEKNAGYASQALALAKDHVARFVALSTDVKAEQMTPLVKRAEAASALIQSDPFAAVQELEIIWYSLEKLIAAPVAPAGTPAAPAAATTPTPAATVAVSPTPAATISPTPVSTPTSGVTPAPTPAPTR